MGLARVLRAAIALIMVAIATTGPALAGSAGPTQFAAPTAQVRGAAGCNPGRRACPIRISFDPGAFSGQAHSRLTGINSRKWFVVSARDGQTMIVVVQAKSGDATSGIVYFPEGGFSGQPGGRVFDESLPSTGDYLIRVAESQMGQAFESRVDVAVLIY